MEKRISKRIVIGFEVELSCGTKTYDGIIEDLSEKGAGVTTVISEAKIDSAPGETVDLKFQPCSDETIILHCRVKWVKDAPPRGMRSRIGLEIMDPPWDESGCFL